MCNFLVDSNFFIQAHRLYYPFDVVPSFWERVKDLTSRGIICSLDKVKNEICANGDELSEWIRNNLDGSVFKDSEECLDEYRSVTGWAISKNDHFSESAIAEFCHADEADAWLISFALKKGIIVITHEVSAPGSKKKIKMPDVCNQFGVRYMNTIEMFRTIGERF